MSFIQERGTGQEKYDAPKFINFCRGDVNDTSSEASEDESFSVAQYPRSINPAYRTSSPHPSTYESHHDPSSELAMNMGGRNDPHTPQSREQTVTPQKTPHQPPPGQPDFRRQAAQVQAAFQQQAPADLAPVPHNEYPTDGMTMFCRTDGHQSERSSNTSPIRTPSRDSQSDYSNPSYSSVEPPSGAASPTKHIAAVNSQPVSPNKAVQKKRSGFFGNSPFRRKSKHEKERPQSVLGSTLWGSSKNSSPTRPGVASRDFANQPDDLEPVDPRAHFQLNVGQNVFDVASPDSNRNSPTKLVKNKPPIDGSDSIEAALEELKGVTKQSSHRMSADNYHGLANTPAPGSQMQHPSAAAQRGTPPPSYHDQGMIKHLGAPQPAHTSKSMQAATRKYTNQNADMYGGENRPGSSMAPRSTSPLPIRSTSPRPGMGADNHRSASPNPYANQGRPGYGNQPQQQPNKYGSYSRHNSPGDVGRGAPSPAPYARENRPASSAGGMALQLSQGDGGALGQERRQQGGRPQSYYGGGNNNMVMSQDSGSRTRSKSVVGNSGGPRGGQFGRDGRAVLHFGKFFLHLFLSYISRPILYAANY